MELPRVPAFVIQGESEGGISWSLDVQSEVERIHDARAHRKTILRVSEIPEDQITPDRDVRRIRGQPTVQSYVAHLLIDSIRLATWGARRGCDVIPHFHLEPVGTGVPAVF